MNNGELLIEAINVRRHFSETGELLEILKGVSLSLYKGEMVSITGTSGCGKSTLLHLLGGLDKPTSGQVIFKGSNIFTQANYLLDEYRSKSVGMVFQFHHLLPEFTALENVIMPWSIMNGDKKAGVHRAKELLEFVGLSKRLQHFPSELSGGERQRVAVARALMNSPSLLLADEPSGNLDEENSIHLHELFRTLCVEKNVSVLVVTHDMHLAQLADRQLHLKNGVLL